MKKFAVLLFVLGQIHLTAMADNYLPMSTQINNSIFSPEGTKPMLNLERAQYTNQAIMNLETKYNVQNNTEKNPQSVESNVPKSKFKNLFKGFVVEW